VATLFDYSLMQREVLPAEIVDGPEHRVFVESGARGGSELFESGEASQLVPDEHRALNELEVGLLNCVIPVSPAGEPQ
jgi:hypothetical protein